MSAKGSTLVVVVVAAVAGAGVVVVVGEEAKGFEKGFPAAAA